MFSWTAGNNSETRIMEQEDRKKKLAAGKEKVSVSSFEIVWSLWLDGHAKSIFVFKWKRQNVCPLTCQTASVCIIRTRSLDPARSDSFR